MAVDWDASKTISEVDKAVARGLFIAAEKVRSDAVKSILSGGKSGRLYRRRGTVHQASAPGEAPASDTGTLANSAEAKLVDINRAVVNFSAQYSSFLEFGTTNIAPRPYARPALMMNRDFITEAIDKEVRKVV